MDKDYLKGLTLVKEYDSDIIHGYKEYDSEIPCPKCGAHRFTLEKKMSKGYYENVLHCDTNSLDRSKPRCSGRLAYCEQCKKWYPTSGFGSSGDKYVCKKCNAVNWDLTETVRVIQAKQMMGMAF